MWRVGVLLTAGIVVLLLQLHSTDALRIGRAIADVTGLASEGALYGYAKPEQVAQGLHLRQYSRAFVFAFENKYAAFVVVEVTMISQALHKQVMEQLEDELGGMYNEENVMLSATHSHSAPGGYHTYWMYQAATPGFINETFDALVNGIVQSIVDAHNDVRPASIARNTGELLDASMNRSPYAYYNNPADEIARYQYDVDKRMTLLKFTDTTSGLDLGAVSFFGVHTTSMKNYNHLVSTDNMGYAAQMMERYLNPGALPGTGSVLGAFAQTTEADSSPNLQGSICDVSGDYCADDTSTCPQWPRDPSRCNGIGPIGEQFADTQYIGDKQYQFARNLFDNAVESVGTTIDYRFQWVNMSDVSVVDEYGNTTKTCRPAMGYSFAAGATDGPGIEPFTQAMLEPLENITDIIGKIYNMTEEMIECQAPKPVLLPTGELDDEWPWQPEIIPLQLLRIGNVILVGIPNEVVTMSGRRIEEAVKQTLINNGLPTDIRVIVLSVVNAYCSYLTTFEEYQMQRYEGASTIFGPHALQAYTTKFQELALALATGAPVDRGPSPPDLRGYPNDALGIIKRDDPPEGLTYGDVLEDVDSQYTWGETARAVFVGGNPRNGPTSTRYLEVQRFDVDQWVVEATDANWETKFWYRTSCDRGRNDTTCSAVAQMSNSTIEWDIPQQQQAANYRLVHYGTARRSVSEVVEYTAVSGEFQVVSPPAGAAVLGSNYNEFKRRTQDYRYNNVYYY